MIEFRFYIPFPLPMSSAGLNENDKSRTYNMTCRALESKTDKEVKL